MWRVWKFLTTLACGFKIHEALNNFAHHLWLFVAQQYGEKHKKILSTLHLNSLQMTRWYFSFLLYIASIVCKKRFLSKNKRSNAKLKVSFFLFFLFWHSRRGFSLSKAFSSISDTMASQALFLRALSTSQK